MMMNRVSEYRPDWALKLGGVTTKTAMKKKKMDYATMMKKGGKKGGKGK